MPLIDHITRPLDPDCYYHIYNRANDPKGKIFFNEGNYKYFLRKYSEYAAPYWDTCAYALLPNHFHLLVRTKSRRKVLTAAREDFSLVSRHFVTRHLADYKVSIRSYPELLRLRKSHPALNGIEIAEIQLALYRWVLSERMRRFMLGYSKAVNKQQKRYGSLFQKVFRRKKIVEGHVPRLVKYIHRNPVHHRLSDSMYNANLTSYEAIINADERLVNVPEVLRHFRGMPAFRAEHDASLTHWQEDRRFVANSEFVERGRQMLEKN